VSAKPAAIAGAAASVVAILHLAIANSDLHKWFRQYIVYGPSDHAADRFAGLEQQIGNLAANAVQLTPGVGLYFCAVALMLTTVLLHSRLLSTISASEPAPTPVEPGKHRRAAWVLVVIVVIVVGAAFVASIASSLHGPIPESQTKASKGVGSQQASEEPAASTPTSAQTQQPTEEICPSGGSASISGIVTSKTTGKPAVGDQVVLLDVWEHFREVAHATTDANGCYSLAKPGNSHSLVRVIHQGAESFIAAPKGAAAADITVFDVAPKVQGVSIEADVLEVETKNGQLKVTERFSVHNTSSPPTTQWSEKSFQVVLPAEAIVDGVGGQRPNGLPTTVNVNPDGPKGHYALDFPILPDDGDKDTLFQLAYHMPYSGGKYAFHAQVTLPADSLAVLLPKSMTFTAGNGAAFNFVKEDPSVQTALLKNVYPGKAIDFTVSGSGTIPRK